MPKNRLRDGGSFADETPRKKLRTDDEVVEVPPPSSSPSSPEKSGRGRRGTKTAEERAKELAEDKRIGEIMPSQVFCRMCNSWIRLFKHSDYAPANWRTHAEKCEKRNNWQQIVKAEPEDSINLSGGFTDDSQTKSSGDPDNSKPQNDDGVSDDDDAVKRRLDALLQDKNVKVIEPLRVFCAGCKKWVIMEQQHDLVVWRNHRRICKDVPGMMPLLFTEDTQDTASNGRSIDESIRVQEGENSQRKRKYHRSTGERIQCFLDDLRCGQILPSQVFCLLCEKWVQLSQTVPYVDSNWRRHADRCSTKYSLEATPEGRAELLRQDPRAERVESNAVLCRQCGKWIKLDGRRLYSHYSWNRHINVCGVKTDSPVKVEEIGDIILFNRSAAPAATLTPELAQPSPARRVNPRRRVTTGTRKPLSEDEVQEVTPVESRSGTESGPVTRRTLRQRRKTEPVQPVIDLVDEDSTPEPPSKAKAEVDWAYKKRTAEERMQLLFSDTRCTVLAPNKVKCHNCQRQIGLHKRKDFFISNWLRHSARCFPKDDNSFLRAGRGGVPPVTIAQEGEEEEEEEAAPELGYPDFPDPHISEPPALKPHAVSVTQASDKYKFSQLPPDPPVKKALRQAANLNTPTTSITKPNTRGRNRYLSKATIEDSDEYDDDDDGDDDDDDDDEIPNGIFGSVGLGDILSGYEPSFSSTDIPVDPIPYSPFSMRNEETPDGTSTSTTPARMSASLTPAKSRSPAPIAPVLNPNPITPTRMRTRRSGLSNVVTADSLTVDYPSPKPSLLDVLNRDGSLSAGNSPGALSSLSSVKRSHRSADLRRRDLIADLRIKDVEASRVLCKMCEKWIQLRRDIPYAEHNWLMHVQICERKKRSWDRDPTRPPRLWR